MAPYQYIIAVDFEATCWEDQPFRSGEIIEFPAVLYNLNTGCIEAIFHEYIKPIENPQLTDFCLKLTGIKQKDVDNGVTLENALKKFHEWLGGELKSRNLKLPNYSKTNKEGNCAFVTWTCHDFESFLERECRRKNIRKPQYFNQWIDIRYIFRKWYGINNLKFEGALKEVGLKYVGKPHSGIDDAKNVAYFTKALIEKGVRLVITKNLTPFKELNDDVLY
ncbi:3'-5' exonuclease Snipper-like [Cochliomyia hominivorax]